MQQIIHRIRDGPEYNNQRDKNKQNFFQEDRHV